MKVYASIIAILILILLTVPAVAERRDVEFTVEPGFTRIEYRTETLFIDYHNSRLFRINSKTNECTSFPFSPAGVQTDSSPDAMLWEQRGQLFGKVELRGGKGTARRLLFGPDVMRLRPVTSPELSRYGQSFFPGPVDFTVQFEHELFPQLQKIAEYNEPYYEGFPLLRQVDLLGLLRYLDGVPRQKKSRNHAVLLTFKVLPVGEVRQALPDRCFASSQ